MQKRRLGPQGPMISAIGLGCMSFAGSFGATDEATSLHCLDAALDRGIDFFDTANVYGMGRSEEVLGTWLASRRPRVAIATKAGFVRNPGRTDGRVIDNSEAYLREELEASLKRLGRDHVELFYIHRHDQLIPIEDVAGTFSRLIEEGKIGGYGLSEVAPYTLCRAHAVHPCAAVQSEYSLWSRMPELGLLQACAELGTAFVPFSPLARGVLGETYPDTAAMAEGDFRLQIPRFAEPNYAHNRARIDPFKAFARSRGWTVAATALAWILDRWPHAVPIPGTRTADHLGEWAGASEIRLTAEDRAEIDRLLPVGFAHGDRYSDQQMKTVERYC
jgi:aryl-alcohol dehydrogenase-like predicted oxidoreductase